MTVDTPAIPPFPSRRDRRALARLHTDAAELRRAADEFDTHVEVLCICAVDSPLPATRFARIGETVYRRHIVMRDLHAAIIARDVAQMRYQEQVRARNRAMLELDSATAWAALTHRELGCRLRFRAWTGTTTNNLAQQERDRRRAAAKAEWEARDD